MKSLLTEAGHGGDEVDKAHAPVAVEEARWADEVHDSHDLDGGSVICHVRDRSGTCNNG